MRMLLTWLKIQPKRWLVLIGIELFLVGAFLTLLFVMPPYERPSAPDTATGRAPMITAPPAVVKVKAPQESQQAEDERVGNIVYDRVAGPTASLTQEQVIDNTDEPQEVPHIVLPPAPVDDEPPLIASIGETADPIVTGANRREGGSAEVPAGYRRLPIYIIRPDGRIVTTGKTPAGEAATVATPERHVAPATSTVPSDSETVVTVGTRSSFVQNVGAAMGKFGPIAASILGGVVATVIGGLVLAWIAPHPAPSERRK